MALNFSNKHRGRTIAALAGILALLCYAVTAASYFLNKHVLPYAIEWVYLFGIIFTLYFLGYAVYCQSKKKTVRENTHLVVSALIFFFILVFIYLIAAKHHRLIDVTENKRYSLSDQTLTLIKDIPAPVEILGFYNPNGQSKDQMQKLFEQYSYKNKNITWRLVNPQQEPSLTEQYGIEAYGEVVLRTEGRSEKVRTATEEGIANGLLKLLDPTQKKIAFLSGHAEPSISDTDKLGYSELAKYLKMENYDVSDLLLLRADRVPADTACLVIASPKTELFESEVDSIDAYVGHGGSVLVMIDPTAVESLENMLRGWGVEAKKGVIIDTLSHVFGASPLMPVVMQYVPHPITEKSKVASFFPTARMIDLAAKLPDGFSGHSLAYTGPGSWLETTPITENSRPSLDKDVDIPGPISVMVVVEKKIEPANGEKETNGPRDARIVVVGDSNFVDNAHIGLSGNKDLFLNTIAWLVRDEKRISIRDTMEASTPMFLSGFQQLTIFVIPVVMLPLGFLIAGIIVVMRMRRN